MIDYRASYKKTIYLALLVGAGCGICGIAWGWFGSGFVPELGTVLTAAAIVLPAGMFVLVSLFCFAVVLGGIFALQADWRK